MKSVIEMPRGRIKQTPQDARRDSEKRILDALLEGPKTYTQLLKITRLSEPTITERLKSLEKTGDISREMNPKDRRSKIYTITTAGITHLRNEEIFQEITQSSMQLNSEFSRWLAWLKGKSQEKSWSSHYSAVYDVSTREKWKVINEWKKEIGLQFKELLGEKYPTTERKILETNAHYMTNRFFQWFEMCVSLNIISSLKQKPIGISKFEVPSGKIKKDPYAKIWSQLFKVVTLLLMDTFSQYEDLEDFLKNTQGKKVFLIIELNLEKFHEALQHSEKSLFASPSEIKAELEY